MKVLVVDPGPAFSVADVFNGWVHGLKRYADVQVYNLGDRLGYHEQALKAAGTDPQTIADMACEGIRAACFDWWPDLVVIISSFYIPPRVYDVLRLRKIPVAVILTESPYEDDSQVLIAERADIVAINDPTNIERFRQHNPNTHYFGHAYNPDRHHPRPPVAEYASDFCFVGTGFPGRIAFLEAVDWSGIDVALGGNWQNLPDASPLLPFVAHDLDACLDNRQTVELYTSAKASANLYRTEAQRPDLLDGWAAGPREIELAACGTFFLREPRGESDQLFPMLPTFDGPDDFGDQLRWWLAHDMERREAARLARAAVADRTFFAHAERLLSFV